MKLNKYVINQFKKLYRIKKKEIISRLKEFEKIWSDKNDEEIFTELAFCILTPQSRAKLCWDAIVKLREKDLLLKGNAEQIRQGLSGVRFKNKKAKYIVKARKLFMTQNRIKAIPSHHPLVKGGRGDFKVNNNVSLKPILSKFVDVYECRDWLEKNINGLGYKEASHFLRNIGFGEKIAILDRHILRNLKEIGIIEEIPKYLNRSGYSRIEKNMIEFSKQINIPPSHLDLLLWSKETGEIFK